MVHSEPSFAGTYSDLDSYSMQDDTYNRLQPQGLRIPDTDEFGFDPPIKGSLTKAGQIYNTTATPPEDKEMYGDFDFDPTKTNSNAPIRAVELDKLMHPTFSDSGSTVTRFGQVTPPRSNSETSIEKPHADSTTTDRRRRTSKIVVKEEHMQAAVPGRKRRNARKLSIASSNNPEEDDKRKQSLEKNRLAAAKCRVNKKEKTEQLQRDSHDKAVQNAFLKDQIMRMKEEVQQMNALLLAHANCDGCKSPEDIQKHLSHLGQEYYAQQMSNMVQTGYPAYPTDLVYYESDHAMTSDYYSPVDKSGYMNPPLPDFDKESNFDISTPMHTD